MENLLESIFENIFAELNNNRILLNKAMLRIIPGIRKKFQLQQQGNLIFRLHSKRIGFEETLFKVELPAIVIEHRKI